MNGVALDTEFEQFAVSGEKTGVEVSVFPASGGFAADVNDSKAFAGRFAYSPGIGHELAGSCITANTPPISLTAKTLGDRIDGRTEYGPFELEGQWIFTRFDGTQSVAQSLARVAVSRRRSRRIRRSKRRWTSNCRIWRATNTATGSTCAIGSGQPC